MLTRPIHNIDCHPNKKNRCVFMRQTRQTTTVILHMYRTRTKFLKAFKIFSPPDKTLQFSSLYVVGYLFLEARKVAYLLSDWEIVFTSCRAMPRSKISTLRLGDSAFPLFILMRKRKACPLPHGTNVELK